MYKLKRTVTGGITPKQHTILTDLLTVMPVLKKHELDADVRGRVKQLRKARKASVSELTLTRIFHGVLMSSKKVYEKPEEYMKALKSAKLAIRMQIQEARATCQPKTYRYSFPSGYQAVRMDEVFVEPGQILAAYLAKVRIEMGKPKKPSTSDPYVGVEIEFASKVTRQVIGDALHAAQLGKYITLKDDGSIGSGSSLLETHRYAHEMCILVKQSEYVDVIQRICDVLNKQCQVKVDKTCGLHVHLDMRNRNVEKAFANLVTMQHFLYRMSPVARRTSRYSIPIKGKQWRVSDDRYFGINSQAYQKFKTLETRIHSGTTDARKILAWVAINIAIADAEEIARAPTTTKGFQKSTGISDELATYIKQRVAKFKAQHARHADDASLLEVDPTEAPSMPDAEDIEEASEAA